MTEPCSIENIENIENIEKYILESLSSNQDKLEKLWKSSSSGGTTKYLMLDNVLPTEICEDIYKAFPRNLVDFTKRKTFRESKKTLTDMSKLNSLIKNVTFAFQSKRVVECLSGITGIKLLESDPSLYAAGASVMSKNDFLNPHIDNSHNADRSKYRRLNLLYYISPDWSLENGGNLELWDTKVKKPVEILSKCNRLVVMDTNPTSWHSVNPVTADKSRICLSNYLFSRESPTKDNYYHITAFTGRPNEIFKRTWGAIDNEARQFVAKKFKLGRGRSLINSTEK